MSDPAWALGRLDAEGAWIGMRAIDGGYQLVVRTDAGARLATPATDDDLLAAALAYFEEALPPAPTELEATHADIGAVMRWLAGRQTDPERRRLLSRALDAVDDGLAAEEVMARLAAALPAGLQSDPIGYLRARARRMLAGP